MGAPDGVDELPALNVIARGWFEFSVPDEGTFELDRPDSELVCRVHVGEDAMEQRAVSLLACNPSPT